MKHQEFTIDTTDGIALYGQSWQPEGAVSGLVCLVHGFGEHSGRYQHVGQALSAAGYAMVAMDQRGHGKSPEKRGYTPSFDQAMRDIGSLIATGQRHHPDVPTILYGHSMGGGMVLNYVLRHRPELAGVISTSPWLRLAFEPPATQITIAKLIGRIMPKYSTSSTHLNGVLSRDPEIDKLYHGDPLVHEQMSVKLFVGMADSGPWAIEHAAEFPLPLLIMHGDDDKVTSMPASQEFANAAPADLITFQVWAGGYHELHNDLEKEAMIAQIISWIDGRMAAQ